tara:strand:- start:845 stop:1027 length:183 start_codon:yes stop_codon:yes gene_type:complete
MSYGEILKQTNFGTSATTNDIGFGNVYLEASLLNQLFIRSTNFENFEASFNLLTEFKNVL